MKKFHCLSIILVLGLLIGCSSNSESAEEETKLVDKSENLKGTGESGNDILSNTNFDKILIEAAYVEGFKPSDGAMDSFVDYLKQHSFKDDIEISYKKLSSPGKENISLEEINELEQENRTAYNDGSTLAFYIYFVDAPSDEDDEDNDLVTLGAVYRNTSMVIYEKTIINLASKSFLITSEDIEGPTLNHEFGHLFGLVNLGFEDDLANPLKTNMVNDHEDNSAPYHCTTAGCLMRAELQINANKGTTNTQENGIIAGCKLNAITVLNMINTQTSKSAATPLGPECILDLQANGGR